MSASPRGTKRSGDSVEDEPQSKRARPAPESTNNAFLDFFSIVGMLKTTKRTGWVNSGVQLAESVSDHMYRMALMAMMLPESGDVDRVRCMKMALVHDLAESLVGDLAPSDNVSKEDKNRMEVEAIEKITSLLGDSIAASEISELFHEYEAAETADARFVKDIDKFEMVMQAYEYERDQGLRLQSFFDSTDGKIKHPLVKGWDDALRSVRDERGSGNGEASGEPPSYVS